jgi:hypothetical protein
MKFPGFLRIPEREGERIEIRRSREEDRKSGGGGCRSSIEWRGSHA